MLPQNGSVVWIDGKTPALVVGHGVDENNVGNGVVYYVELGTVSAIAADDTGVYNFGDAPYSRDTADGVDQFGRPNVSPGGFGPTSELVQNTDVANGGESDTTSYASPSSSSGAPLTPGAPGQFSGDAEPGTGTSVENPAVPVGTMPADSTTTEQAQSRANTGDASTSSGS